MKAPATMKERSMSVRHQDPKAKRIQELDCFAQADRKALRHLVSATDEVDIEAGHTLISAGHNHEEGFVVERGRAEVIIDGLVVAEIGEGQMIGELSMFDRQPASATVRAKTDMTLLVLPYNRVEQILDDNPAMVRAVAKGLAARLRATDAKLY